MSSARVIARNLVANWVGHGANLVVMFFLTPFVIHTLGLPGYGLWGVLNVVTGYMGLLDIGVRASTGRHIILYIGKGDHKSVDETIRTSLTFFSCIGAVFIVLGLILGWAFPMLFRKVPSEYYGVLPILMAAMAANMWLSTFRSVLCNVLSAHERFDLARGLDLVMLAIRTVGTIIVLKMGYGIVGLTAVVVGCNAVGLAGNWLLARWVYSRLRIWPLAIWRSRLRELFSYGVPAAISTASVKIIGQTDVVLVGAAISLGATGIYTAGANWLYYSATLLSMIQVTFFPPVQRAVAQGKMGEAKWLFLRQIRLGAIFGLPLFVGFICFGRPFLQLWLYDPVKFPQSAIAQAAMVMGILAASKLLILLCSGANSLLAAMGHIRFTAALSVTEAIVNLGLSLLFVLVLDWGLIGVAAGTLAARLLTRTPILPWYVCRKAKLSLWRFVTQTGGRIALTGGIFGGICLLVQWLIPCRSWVVFWPEVCLVTVCYIPIAMVILVPRDDQKRILTKLKLIRPVGSAPDLRSVEKEPKNIET